MTGAGLNRAGWQEGLRQALTRSYPDLKISIASFGSDDYQPIRKENVTYYNIFRGPVKGNRWQRVVESWKHRTFNQEDLSRIVEIYNLVEPDLVFIFGTENPFGLLADKFAAPTVISIQAVINGLVENLFFGLTGSQLIREFFSRQTLAGQGIFHKWWSQKKHARIEKQIYQRNKYFSGRTDWDQSWMKKLNPEAIYFHVDRVLREPFYKASWELKGSYDQRIFSLCGNAPFKGGITSARSLAYLKKKGSDQIKLRLAGVDPDSSVGLYINEILQENGMENQIDLLGRLNPDQIITEMKEARVFVLPSHMDNSPNSLAEAMILGMPCIASNAGGIPSIFQENMDGLLYPHNDIQALAEKITLVLNDSELALSLGDHARKQAQERHNPSRIAKSVLSMYQKVLSLEGAR